LYSASTEDKAPPPDTGKYVRIGLIILIGVVIFAIVGNQGVVLSMNISEFESQFTKPLFYSVVSALVLVSIALVRVNIKNRSSIAWYAIQTGLTFLRKGAMEPVSQSLSRYQDYKLTVPGFVVWQITKVLLFGAFFVNIMFGFATIYVLDGNDLGVQSLLNIFLLPFVTPPTDPSYATEIVVPMIPALLVLIPPILAAIALRLVLYVGLHSIIKVVTNYVRDSIEGKSRYLHYISTFEGIIGIGVLWSAFTLFFTDDIDYNTRYAIGGTLAVGSALIAFSFIDRYRAKILTHIPKRDVYIRVLTILAITIIVGSVMSVNDSIADARKLEFLGPYTAQQIGVNRHFAELDKIEEKVHDVELIRISPNDINSYVEQNSDVLDVIRVWDWTAAFAKLKPEIGLIPYVDFEDNDILRFNNTLYWTTSMKPILPPAVALEDQWYNEHLVYTHVPDGFLTLDATSGSIVDSSKFFDQRSIYYGEGGLLDDTWSAYPTTRGDVSAELNNVFYAGGGGLTVTPPLSWIFEPNFLLSFPSDPIHIMRYKDLIDRMDILYPYFLYGLFGHELDSFPVTDGEKTYWLIPLLIGFDTQDVPWSVGNPYLRLVGYGLMDTYNGDISFVIQGDDFFSEMFVSQYEDRIIETPEWLEEQVRYPNELFTWKTEMYNTYHITDVETFIQANEFYEIPRGLETYYVEAKPPDFNENTFIGLLSLELRGSQGRNLAGFMVVENDLPNLGKMQFYEVPLDSETKLIGPTAVREALDRDPDFAQLKTLLRNPRIGDNILYRVGDHDVYFIPVYTAGAGGVVAQLGTIAAVGAAFTGEYYVGLGNTQEEAFEAYLAKVSGISPTAVTNGFELDRTARIDAAKSLFEEQDLTIVNPTSVQIPLSFQEGEISFFTETDLEDTKNLVSEFVDKFVKPRSERVILWEENDILNFGTIVIVDGVAEMHYVSIEVGK